MSDREFELTTTCEICAVGELTETEKEGLDGLVIALATGGLDSNQVGQELADSPVQRAAVLSCGQAIKRGLCLRYSSNLNPGGGYDG